jgi:hypothetical protein
MANASQNARARLAKRGIELRRTELLIKLNFFMKPMVSYLLIQSQYYKDSLGSLLLSPHCSGGFGFTAGVRKAVVDLAPATLIISPAIWRRWRAI